MASRGCLGVERKAGGHPLGEEGDEVQEGCQQRLARRLRPAAPRCAGMSGAPRLAGCGVGRGRGQGGMAWNWGGRLGDWETGRLGGDWETGRFESGWVWCSVCVLKGLRVLWVLGVATTAKG
jgi:hypothetical protein